MLNLVVLFTFSVLDIKHPFFLANFIQKMRIVPLSRNLVPTLIRICKFNGGVHFFLFYTEAPYLVNEGK